MAQVLRGVFRRTVMEDRSVIAGTGFEYSGEEREDGGHM